MKVAVLHETPIPRGGNAFDLVTRMLRAVGIKEYEFVYLGKMGTKFTKAESWQGFHQEIVQSGELDCDKILALGGVPLTAVLGETKGRSIQKNRGRGYVAPHGQYMVATYSPFTVFKDWDFFRDFAADIYKLATSDKVLPQPDDYNHKFTINDLDHVLELLEDTDVLAVDIETLGFQFLPHGGELLSCCFCGLQESDAGSGTVITAECLDENRWILEKMESRDKPVVFHNMKFDIQHLSGFMDRELLMYHNAQDTMLLHYALDERPSNRYRVHGLKILSRVYYDAPDYEIPMGKWLDMYADPELAAEDRTDMLNQLYWYQFQDTWYTRRLHETLTKEMSEREECDDLHRFLENHLYPATLALGEIERHGVPIQKAYLESMSGRIMTALVDELGTLRQQVMEITGGEMEDFNPNSPVQVKKVVYDYAGCKAPDDRGVGRYAYKNRGKQTTDKDVLKVLASIAKQEGRELVATCLNMILTYRQRSKILGTYVTGMLERCEQTDDPDWSVIHATFFTAGTATARLSCANPNLQNIPDASHVGEDVRSAFAAPPGYVMLEADYSQLELRVAGLFSKDPALLQVYRDGRDIHQEVAFNLWQKPKEQVTKYERYLAKCLNFGLIYGRGARSIATGPEMDMLEQMRGARWTPREVEVYYRKFLKGFPRLVKWMGEQGEFVRKNYYVDTPFGNRRRFNLVPDGEWHRIERQAVNSPIQGFASLMCMDALRRIHCRLRDEHIDARIIFTVHDSITFLVVEDEAVIRQVTEIVFHEMEQNLPELPGVDWDLLPFRAEVEIKRTWGGKEDEAFAHVLADFASA